MRTFLSPLWHLLRRSHHDADLREEMETHRSLRQEKIERDGPEATDADAASRRAFGNATLAREDAREVWLIPAIANGLRDLRVTVRGLRRSPGFTLVTIATLALGIGATTVASSLVHTIVLSPLGYREPDRLVFVQQVVPEIAHQYPILGVNPRSFLRWQESCQTSCDGMAAFASDAATLTGVGEPEGLIGARVSPSLFELLGVAPLYGRRFNDADAVPGDDRVVILTYGFWQRRFAGDPGVIGQTIQLNDVPIEVVGVLPDTFRFPQIAHRDASRRMVNAPDYLRPLAWSDGLKASWGEYDNAVVMRLPGGVTVEAARAELETLTAAEFSDAPIHPYPVVEPLAATITSDASRPLWLLLAAVLSALLIACVNVANLLAARWMGRQRELSIRTAVGAGRARLVSLVATESLLLAAVGGVLGVAAAWLALDVVVARVPLAIPRLDDVRLDMASLAFAATLTGGCALVCSALPAWRTAGVDPGDALKTGTRNMSDNSRWARPRRWLVGVEVALTTMLLVVGGLLLASFVNVLRVDPGFSTTSIVGVDLSLPNARYPTSETRARFFDDLLRSLDDDPAIDTAGVSRVLPLEGDAAVDAIVADGDVRPIGEQAVANHVQVSPGYLDTIGLSLVHGRLLTPDDRGRRVAVISERTARTVWTSPEASLGRTFSRGNRDMSWEVVGVVADARLRGLERDPGLVVYAPYTPGNAQSQLSLVVRSRPDVTIASTIDRVRRAVRALDPQLPLQRVRTLDAVVDDTLALRRFQLRVVAAFAAVGLLIACIGIYGVSASAVEGRRNELAVRLALGATPSGVRRLVVRQGMAPVVVGLVAGLGLGIGAARIVASTLFGVAPAQPVVVAAVAAIMLLVTVVACLGPALRAARTPLASTLRA